MKKRVGKNGSKKSKVFNNRLLYTLISLGILILVAAGIYAASGATGSVPNPGHSVDQLQSCGTQGQVLQVGSDGKWHCVDAGSLGGSSSSAPTEIKITTSSHNGNFGGTSWGYPAMEAWIQTNGCSGYHVCTGSEITAALKNGVAVPYIASGAWYDSMATPHFYASTAYATGNGDDCAGWVCDNYVKPGTTTMGCSEQYPGITNGVNYGSTIRFGAFGSVTPNPTYPMMIIPKLQRCDGSYPVLCCK